VSLSTNSDLRLARINQKGLAVAQRLQQLKAGKDVNFEQLADLTCSGSRLTPEERLRQYLDQINRARTRLLEGAYGQCLQCKQEFLSAQLDEMPWVELCVACDAPT